MNRNKSASSTYSLKKINPSRHSWLEDGIAILLGAFLFSVGLIFIKQAELVTGGTPGLALLISYATHLSFSTTLLIVNAPFFYLAVRRKGWEFTLKTCIAIGLLSYLSPLQSAYIHLNTLQPLYGAVTGSCLLAVSFVILFSHNASLGGVSVLALYLQDHWGIRAGYFQLGLDLLVMAVTCFIASPNTVAISAVGVIIVNLIIAMSHRPDRYSAT